MYYLWTLCYQGPKLPSDKNNKKISQKFNNKFKIENETNKRVFLNDSLQIIR